MMVVGGGLPGRMEVGVHGRMEAEPGIGVSVRWKTTSQPSGTQSKKNAMKTRYISAEKFSTQIGNGSFI